MKLDDEGVAIIVNRLLDKMGRASNYFDCEEGKRTILNIDDYDLTVLYWALHSYMQERNIKRG